MKETPDGAPEQPDVQGPLKSERIGARLTESQIEAWLSGLSGWEVVDGGTALRRTFELPSFRAAVAFQAYVVELAEAMDHRPGIHAEDNAVTLTLTTHTVGGLTDRDFELASRIYR